MNLLFVTEIEPFPPSGGEKLRSFGLLKLLSELKLNVHAIIGNSSQNNSFYSDFKGISFHPFNFCYEWDYDKIRSIGKIKWGLRRFIRDKELVSLIDNILLQNKIDVVFIDYYFYGQYIGIFRKRKIPVIYGTHNAQARLINQRPADTFKERIIRFRDFLLNRLHEVYYFRKADALIVVSDPDKKYHRTFIRKDKIFVIPNFLIASEYDSHIEGKEHYILMAANFWAYQNAIGLEWFLREIWDQELWNRTQLLIVGIGSQELFDKRLKGNFNLTNVNIIGEVDNLKPYVAKALVSIVPLLHGSGSRLKCLESMILRTQLVSTSKGAEGIEHENSIVIADTPGEFKKALLDVLDGKINSTENAYRTCIKKYSLSPNKGIFVEILQRFSVKTKSK